MSEKYTQFEDLQNEQQPDVTESVEQPIEEPIEQPETQPIEQLEKTEDLQNEQPIEQPEQQIEQSIEQPSEQLEEEELMEPKDPAPARQYSLCHLFLDPRGLFPLEPPHAIAHLLEGDTYENAIAQVNQYAIKMGESFSFGEKLQTVVIVVWFLIAFINVICIAISSVDKIFLYLGIALILGNILWCFVGIFGTSFIVANRQFDCVMNMQSILNDYNAMIEDLGFRIQVKRDHGIVFLDFEKLRNGMYKEPTTEPPNEHPPIQRQERRGFLVLSIINYMYDAIVSCNGK